MGFTTLEAATYTPARLNLADGEIAGNLDGGSAFHINLAEYPSPEQCKHLFKVVAASGCPYFCINVKGTACEHCDFIDPKTYHSCPKCGSLDIKHYTRVIGYVRFEENFSAERQVESGHRFYHWYKH